MAKRKDSYDDCQLISRADAAERLGLSSKTLANWASMSPACGPTPVVMYGRVFYRESDVEEFAKAREPEGLLSPKQAASLLAMSPRTLANWRCNGMGPRFVRHGQRIWYPKSGVADFIKSRQG